MGFFKRIAPGTLALTIGSASICSIAYDQRSQYQNKEKENQNNLNKLKIDAHKMSIRIDDLQTLVNKKNEDTASKQCEKRLKIFTKQILDLQNKIDSIKQQTNMAGEETSAFSPTISRR